MKILTAAMLALLLTACDSSGDLGELQQFVEETVNREPGPIEPLPEFVSYEPFTYSAASLRSPFDAPVDPNEMARREESEQVRPDPDRPREELEEFSLSNLRMVGSISRASVRWALVQDPSGAVHRVTAGNYLGRNHGQVVAITNTGINIVEIVPSGEPDAWRERSQTVPLDDGTQSTQVQE